LEHGANLPPPRLRIIYDKDANNIAIGHGLLLARLYCLILQGTAGNGLARGGMLEETASGYHTWAVTMSVKK
jgi:hypothetical protein